MVEKTLSVGIFVTILFLSFIFSNCGKSKNCPDGSHNRIVLNNNSNTTINRRVFGGDSIYYTNGADYDFVTLPNSSDNITIRGETCWEEYFRDVNGGYSYLLIFNNDSVNALGWNTISGTNRGLLKVYKIDLEFLLNNNFTINYP